MIIVDIRPLAEQQKTGVAQSLISYLDSVFFQDKKNTYILFFNYRKKINKDIWRWKKENIFYVRTRWPSKLLNLFIFMGWVKLDKFILRRFFKKNKTIKDDDKGIIFYSPNISFINLSKKSFLVLNVHDFSFQILPECFDIKKRFWHLVVDPREQIKRANKILVPSENTKQDLDFFCKKIKKDLDISVMRPALNRVFFDKNNFSKEKISEVKNKYNLPGKYILFLASLEPRKNLLSLLDAFEKVQNIKIVPDVSLLHKFVIRNLLFVVALKKVGQSVL